MSQFSRKIDNKNNSICSKYIFYNDNKNLERFSS